MNDDAGRRYDFRVIPIAAIDPPARSMREQMDDAGLDELRVNIQRNGILQPLGVVPVGDRFRISWGHRRFIAAGMAGEMTLPCRVLLDGDVREEEFKYVENTFRENVNPAEEASWLADLLDTRYGGDIETLCAALNVKESTVNGRLDLLRGDPAVLAALKAREIGIGVARELNKMREPSWRAYRLGDAIAHGSTERVVRDWRISDEKHLSLQRAAENGELPTVPPSTEVPIGSADRCELCGESDDPTDMEYVRVHRSCARIHRRELARHDRASA
jgi:ParB/RepB/Spo0J family partition protein